MPRYLNTSYNVKHYFGKSSPEVPGAINILGVSDSNIGGESTITDYIKGPLPAAGTVLIVEKPIDGYVCFLADDPTLAIYSLISYLQSEVGFKPFTLNNVDSTVKFGKNVVLENNVEIGAHSIIEHNVVIHSGSKIGRHCIIRSGAVVGGQGYGFTSNNKGEFIRQPFLGGVILGNNVEIGYNSVVAAGAIESTILKNGVKLDNQVHIAHDCEIGEYSTVTAGVSFCGYVKVGQNVRLAPNSTVKQRLTIGDNAIVGLGAVVTKNVEEGAIVAGNPAKVLRK